MICQAVFAGRYFINSGISSPSSGAHAYSQLRARMHESCMHILDPLRSDHALYARTSTARTMHVWAAPYKMYEAPYILPYMTGNLRPTAQSHQPTVCINLRPQYKLIVYFSLQGRYCTRSSMCMYSNTRRIVPRQRTSERHLLLGSIKLQGWLLAQKSPQVL